MKIKVIAIGGVPGTGKSTLMFQVKKDLAKDWHNFKFGKIRGYTSKSKSLMILGVYDGSLYQGTDKLSMTAVSDLYSLVQSIKVPVTILFEGDRLFSTKVIETLKSDSRIEIAIAIVTTTKQKERFIRRGSTQSATFLKSKDTKINNMLNFYKNECFVFANDTESDLDLINKWIINQCQ